MVPEGWKARLEEVVGLEEINKTRDEKSNRMKRMKRDKNSRNMCIKEESTKAKRNRMKIFLKAGETYQRRVVQ